MCIHLRENMHFNVLVSPHSSNACTHTQGATPDKSVKSFPSGKRTPHPRKSLSVSDDICRFALNTHNLRLLPSHTYTSNSGLGRSNPDE